MSLNPQQHDAVHTLKGPLLVLAGAGTGKTRVVTMRIAKLIRSGIRADRILGVTFTNKAATEMQQRLSEMLGRKMKLRPQISTFHSHCVRVLRNSRAVISRVPFPKAVLPTSIVIAQLVYMPTTTTHQMMVGHLRQHLIHSLFSYFCNSKCHSRVVRGYNICI